MWSLPALDVPHFIACNLPRWLQAEGLENRHITVSQNLAKCKGRCHGDQALMVPLLMLFKCKSAPQLTSILLDVKVLQMMRMLLYVRYPDKTCVFAQSILEAEEG